MKPTWHYSFLLFHFHNPPQNLTTEFPVVEQSQDQHKVRHEWSICVLLFLLKEIQMSTQGIWKFFTKNVKIRLIFHTLSSISPKWYAFCLNFMHDGRAVIKRVQLAPKYQGHWLSVQCYEFYLHAILFM